VAGMYRTGKSYLLNRMLLNRSSGFGVGPSINPCTKGLWIWGTPITGFTPSGDPINVLVVDTEGMGGLDEDNNHDVRIFSLALLLSSYFLYNSVGSIDENALSSLSLVVNLSKHIQFKQRNKKEGDSSSDEDWQAYMPSFMWVVRDFTLQLVDEEGNDITSKEYLERALDVRASTVQQDKNEIRKHLKKFFKERECCTMIRPLTNEDNLQCLDQMDLEELRAEFVEQVMLLRRKVLNQVRPKQVNGSTLDGTTWVLLAEKYIQAINEGAVPNIQSSWNYICHQKARATADTIVEKFEKELADTLLPMNQEDIEGQLGDLVEDSMVSFSKSAIGEEDILREYIEDLKGKLVKRK